MTIVKINSFRTEKPTADLDPFVDATKFPSFGRCPICKEAGERLEAGPDGKDDWMICREHAICWRLGWNMFANWNPQTADQRQANDAAIAACKIITIDEAYEGYPTISPEPEPDSNVVPLIQLGQGPDAA